MNATATAPAAWTAATARSRSMAGHRAMLVVAILSCVLMLAVNVFRRDGYTGDEGFYGVTAQNMLRSPEYILRPSYFPGGDFTADRDGFAHPPFNSYFYAVALLLARGSLVGPEVLCVLAFAALLFVVHRIVARFDRRAARFAVILLAASVPMVGYYSMLEAEPLMVLFGLVGLWGANNAGARPGARYWYLVSGLGLGMAFALKLWLIGPLALAIAAALLLGAVRDRIGVRPALGAIALFLSGLIVPAGLHLLAIAWWYPQDLGFWLRNIYFGIFTHAGISGAKLEGDATPAAWIHPVWYYAAALYRDHFFLATPIVFGGRALWRDRRRRGALALIALAGALGVMPLSLIKVKEPLYVLSCAVFLYVLAAACLSALTRVFAAYRRLDRASLVIGTTASVVLLAVFPLALWRGIQPDKITGTFVLAHTLVHATFLAAIWWAHLRRSSTGLTWLVWCAVAIAMISAGAWNALAHVPRDRTIARLVQPYLERNPEAALSLIASNFKDFQYHTFHRGMYWHELPPDAPEVVLAKPGYKAVTAFVLSPEDLQRPAIQPWVSWLDAHTEEKTEDLDRDLGRVSGWRVFVRPKHG